MIQMTEDGHYFDTHPPGDEVAYGFNWHKGPAGKPPFLKVGQTITESEWEIEGDPPNITFDSDQIIDGTQTSVFVRGGVLHTTYLLINRVRISGSNEWVSRTISLVCEYL